MNIRVSQVVGIAQNGVIGFEGDMPWRLSTDMKRFKSITMGKSIIMGRKTFESIGKSLPGRYNIVVSRSGFKADNVTCVRDIQSGLEEAEDWAKSNSSDEICIIGGGEIYRQSLEFANRLYVTHIMAEPDGDTLFAPIEPAQWQVLSSEKISKGEKDSADTFFVIYERI